MRKIPVLILILLSCLVHIQAMPYEEARERARFLTDKMAYELNLNDIQYNDVYEINLDYLLNINTASDLSGRYWSIRNSDLRLILYDWQYNIFRAAEYFYRPVVWRSSGWYYPIVTIYRVNHFYYKPPKVYYVYRGGHWNRKHPSISYYEHRRPIWHSGLRGNSKVPVRQIKIKNNTTVRIDKPDFIRRGESPRSIKDRSIYQRPSSTKSTVTRKVNTHSNKKEFKEKRRKD